MERSFNSKKCFKEFFQMNLRKQYFDGIGWLKSPEKIVFIVFFFINTCYSKKSHRLYG